MSEIECLKFIPKSAGALQGFADIFIAKWQVEIFGVKLFMKNGHRWVSFPSRETEEDGVKKYWPYLRFRTKEHQDLFSSKVLFAIDDFCEKQAQATKEEKPFVEDPDIPF